MKKITRIFVLLTLVIVGVFDVFAIVKGGTEASISHLIFIWSYKYPAFTFLTGFCTGHLFWRMRDTEDSRKISDSTKD